jgi:flagellar biosynthetic protein FlhB
MQRMIAAERMLKNLSRADAVIAGVGDVSTAVRYEGGGVQAPRLVAKGRGAASARIRDMAEENGVPVVEDVALAQALYRVCGVGEEIPRALYAQVAKILAYAFEVKRIKSLSQ